MKDFPSCFGESGVQVADSSSTATKSAQNLVNCLYQAKFGRGSCIITITWSKHLMGQCLSVGIDDSANKCICKLDIKPSLFYKWKGSKCMEAGTTKIDIFWDLSAAKFASGPEPLEGFYVAILFNHEMALFLGDMMKEAQGKTNASPSSANAVFVAKKEHIFGKKVFCTKAQFCDNGQVHDVAIECETVGLKDPSLEIRIDKKRVLQVKRLCWKFRGNQTISVDGISVEVFWDVHNWLFGGHVGSLSGVMDDRGKYIYISPEETKAVADYIKRQGRVSISHLASKSNQFIELESKPLLDNELGTNGMSVA